MEKLGNRNLNKYILKYFLKGGALIRMMNYMISESTFSKGTKVFRLYILLKNIRIETFILK
jgi:hypothetical protein